MCKNNKFFVMEILRVNLMFLQYMLCIFWFSISWCSQSEVLIDKKIILSYKKPEIWLVIHPICHVGKVNLVLYITKVIISDHSFDKVTK